MVIYDVADIVPPAAWTYAHFTNGSTKLIDTFTVVVTGNGNQIGALDTVVLAAVMTNPPVANFSGSPTNGNAPLMVNFTDTSSNNPTSWSWTFGDGGPSTAQNPSHQYTSAGTYTVSLTAANAYGSSSKTNANYITVTAPGMPTFVAAGTFVVTNGGGSSHRLSPPLPAGIQANDILLLFVETANQSPTIYNANGGTWTAVDKSPVGTGTAGNTNATALTVFWSRYNGTQTAPTLSTSTGTSNELAIILGFRGCVTSGNPWDVTATNTDATATTSASIAGATTINPNDLVVAAIATAWPKAAGAANLSGWANGDLSSITERSDNTARAGSSGPGGGGLGTATGGKAVAGAYGSTTVTLATASAKAMMSIALTPGASGSAPVANFSGTPTSGQAPLTVQFTDTSTGSRTNWLWNFGDGGTSTAQNPSHQYNSAGTYGVSLTVSNSAGANMATNASYITVTVPPPMADFSGTPTNGAAPLTVNFTDASTGSPTAWSWTFGDGGTSTAQNPSHQYVSAGTLYRGADGDQQLRRQHQHQGRLHYGDCAAIAGGGLLRHADQRHRAADSKLHRRFDGQPDCLVVDVRRRRDLDRA